MNSGLCGLIFEVIIKTELLDKLHGKRAQKKSLALLVSLGCSGQLGRIGAYSLFSGQQQHQGEQGEHDPTSD